MIIVTGAGGNVGRQLVSRLKEAGAPLRACFNSARKAAEARAAGIDAAVLDYAQPETLGPALAGGEKLFLLSPPERTELEPGVVEAARRAGTRKIVKLSVWGAPSEAFTFARAHRAIERKIEESGILCPTTITFGRSRASAFRARTRAPSSTCTITTAPELRRR